MQYPNEKKNEALIILIGFILIILIISLFFLRSSILGQKKASQLSQNSNVTNEEKFKNFPSINATDLAKKIEAKDQLLILDLREAESFGNEHILDSKNIDITNLENETATFKKEYTYFLIDDLGITPNEAQAMQYLKENGFTNIAYLEGGLTQWKNEFEPTIKAGNPTYSSDQAKVSYIKSDELEALLSSNTKLYLIDVRDKSEYLQEHLSGSVNIPLNNLESRRHELPLGGKIILYDNDGISAFQGAVRLFDAGILNAQTLSDGLITWKQKNYPTTK